MRVADGNSYARTETDREKGDDTDMASAFGSADASSRLGASTEVRTNSVQMLYPEE